MPSTVWIEGKATSSSVLGYIYGLDFGGEASGATPAPG
jgi:hypothetical protein